MSDLPSKLDALGDLLDVQDDTSELELAAPRRPVGEVLRGTPEPTDQPSALPSTAAATAADHGPAPAPSPTTTAPPTVTRSARRRPAPTAQPALTNPPTRASPVHASQRTSANLPVSLVDRLRAAKQRRWELSQLVASALAHVELGPAQADELLDRIWAQTRTQRAYQLPAVDLAQIDTLGAQWRMNRSQVIAVIVPLEMDRLGL